MIKTGVVRETEHQCLNNIEEALKTMSLIDEFKEFIMRGNVLDLAVGFIMGVAFNSVVNSLVNDLIMPPIGFILGGLDFSQYKLVLRPASQGAAEVAIRYGAFINTLVYFLIVSAAVFALVKAANTLVREKPSQPQAPPEPPEEVKLLREIRDILREKQ